ncbi:MAG: hypothetical protein ACI9OD_001513, partial [Limisphaerales bacterium]
TYNDQGATVTDNVDVTRTINTTDTLDNNAVGSYTLSYNAVDAAGNKATELTRTVRVVSPAVMNGIQNLTFDTSGATAVVVDCLTTASGFLEIPATYQGKDVTSIGYAAFHNCTSLISVTIPNTVTSIDRRAFAFLPNLEAIIFKGNAPTLQEDPDWGVFFATEALVYVSSSATGFPVWPLRYGGLRLRRGVLDELDWKVVARRVHITDCNAGASGTMIIPETIEGKPVTRLLFNSFSQCVNLKTVHIPDSVTTIEESTFDRCTSLTEVTIGKGLKALGAGALNSGSDRLKDIIVHPDNPYFSSFHGVLYNKTRTTLRVVPAATTGELVVPESVTLIGLGALEDCGAIDEIFFKPLQAPAIEEEDGDPFWALEGKTAYVRTNSNGYVNHVDFMYESLNIVTLDQYVDTRIPKITLIGDALITIQLGISYTDQGATITDNVDATRTLQTTDSVDSNTVGNYTLDYNAMDAAGNAATKVTRTVKVVDTTRPVITLEGDALITIEGGSTYTDQGARVTDNVDATRTLQTTDSVDSNTVGNYTLRYNAVDAAGNAATKVTRTVKVVDTTPPEITLIGEAWNDIYVGDGFTPDDPKTIDGFYEQLKAWAPGATAEDAVDGPIAVEILEDRYIPISINSERTFKVWHRDIYSEGLYAVVYRATDSSGNTAVAYRKVQVVQEGDAFYTEEELLTADFEPPVITLNGPGRVYVNLGDPYGEQGATAEDAEDGAVEVTIGGSVDTSSMHLVYTGNIVEITYYAKDRFGNQSSATRYVSVMHPNARLLKFKIDDDSVRVVDCDVSISGDLIIPSFWEGKPVTSIGDQTFDRCESLTNVTIPDSVTSIGECAFAKCKSLKSVTIPDSVTSIGGRAFWQSGLTSVTIGNSVTSIGDQAFLSCKSLTSITIPNSVTSIAKDTFYRCKSLISVTIPDSVTSIGNGAFFACESLTSVTIPDSVTSIGGRAFLYSGLTSVTIGNSVTSIGDEAFSGCKSLTSITIPNSVTSIAKDTFSDCESLTSVTIGNSVTSIGNGAFSRCRKLTSVTIPNSVTSIVDYAFGACTSLASITIPDSVTSIGDQTFLYSGSLTSITFEGNAPKTLGKSVFEKIARNAKVYVKANATGFGTTFGGLPVARQGSTTTARKGNTSDGPIMDAVVFFDANLNGLPDEGEPQTTSNGWGDYWLDIPLETYDLNGNGVIDISEGVIVSKGGTDTATGLPMKTILKGPASATVITPLTTLVTRVMEQNPELDAGAAADRLEASLGIPDGVDILSFDTFKEASEENPSAADVLTATAKLQDTLVQGGNLIGGATGKSLQAGSDAVMDALARQVKAGVAVDLDSKGSLKSLITEAANQSGANLTEAQTDGAASIMEASSKAKEDAKAAASTVTELATEVSRVQAVSQSKAADDLKAVGAQTAVLESTVLAYTGAAMQQQVQTEVVGDFNASKREAPVFAFQSASYTVNENGQQQPVIQINRTGGSFEAVQLTVTPVASSATAGKDFNGEPISVIFEPQEIRKTLNLQTLLINDALVEEAQTFSLQLAVVRDPEDPDLLQLPAGEGNQLSYRPTVGTIGLATLTIISDDIAKEAPTINTSDPSNLTLSWEGNAQLLFTENLSAGFEVVAGATSPYTIEQGSMGFYILTASP